MKSFKPLVVIISVFIILSGHNVFAKAMSNADFNGRYIVGHFLEDIGESDPIHTDVLQFDADGKGKISGKGLYSNTGDTGSFNLNYSISQDGRISIDIDTESSLVGIISPDGQYFTLTKSGTNTEPLIMFGIKESTGRSVADLNGNYEMHGILYEDDELQIGGSQTMIFNGSGYWQWHDDPSGSGTYTVNSMGHLTMASHNGMESNDGSVLFIVSTDDPDVLEIIVGIRQSTEMIASDLMGEYCFTEIGTDNPAVSSDDYFYSLDVNSKNAYSFQELANSCGCPLKSGTGNYLMNSNGNFSLGKTAFGTLAEHGNVFAMFGYDEDFGYFGIGIPTSNSMEHELYYPHAASNTKWETEICAINTSSESIDGVFKVYNDKGEAISNDIETTLGAHARKEIIVGDDFTTPSDIGYIIFESDSENVIGYTKFYIDGLYRVAVPAVLDITEGDLYISHIASNNNWWTGVSLVNTMATEKNLTIEFDNGSTKNISLDGYEHKVFSIKSLFDNTPQADLNSAVIEDADGVIGLELFGSSKQLSGILLKNDTAENMHYPHIASNDKWWTGIVAYNPSASSCTLSINPYTAEGMALTSQTIDLSGYEKYIGTVSKLGLPSDSAWFHIEATHPVTGFELFGTSDNKLLAGYTGVNISDTEGIFAKIDKEGWTGIAFVNITDSMAGVDLMAYGDSGNLISTESIELDSFEKMVDNPEDIFSDNIDNATYIVYSSDMELVGFQLNGSHDGMMLDGLPGL